jgi:hypothetical protein
MPRRDDAIVTCSCGLKVGSLSRAASCEEMEDLEHALVASKVPVLVERHWKAGHELRGRGGMAVFALIVRAANSYAKENA